MEPLPCSMEPRERILDGAGIESREQLHDVLTQLLDLPDYYGRNLDALADCLGDRSEPVCVHLIHGDRLDVCLGGYAEALRRVFRDLSTENPAVQWQET